LSRGKKSPKTSAAQPAAARIGARAGADRPQENDSKPTETTKKGVQNVTPHAHAREGKTKKGKARSLQVATAMAAAMTNREIADVTGLTERQVKRIKSDSETRLTFSELVDRKREDLFSLWDESIDGTRGGLKAMTPVVTIGDDDAITPQLVPDFRTRQLAVANSIKMFNLIFSREKTDGPVQITMENAKELLLQIRTGNQGGKR
jgi:hypothetical protein